MPGFDTPTSAPVVRILLDCIGRVEGSDGLWWVAEEAADGQRAPRGIFAGRADAATLANELAVKHAVSIQETSHVDG
jgi:hypothetical protein